MPREFRFAVRMLLKQPGFSLIAILTLALGIGATSAVFSLIQGVLLTPPPYQKPEQLMLLPAARTDGQKMDGPREWAAQQWTEWQKEAKSFAGIAAYAWTFNFLIRGDGSQSMQGMFVTRDYMPVMGLKTITGRGFEDADFSLGPTKVIVLGYEFWQRAFNGDPQIIGKTVRISRWDVPPHVIGVMQPGVRFLPSLGAAKEPNYNVNATVDFWAPAMPDPKAMTDPYWDVVARVREGIPPRQAQEELSVLAAREGQAEPQFEGFTPQLEPLTDEMNRDGRRILLPLLGAASLVLLIGCGNAAALLLVRGLQRQQEYAVRGALGMGRVALFRQVLTEGLLLALLGGTFGVVLAFGVVKSVQVDCGASRSAARWSDRGLVRVGVGLRRGGAGFGFRRDSSRTASVSPGSDGGSEKCWAKRHCGIGRAAAFARSHHGADGLDVGAASWRRTAHPHHAENRKGALGLQHRTDLDDECHGGAVLQLGQLSPTGLGASCGPTRSAIRCVCLGSAPDRKQLARDSGN